MAMKLSKEDKMLIGFGLVAVVGSFLGYKVPEVTFGEPFPKGMNNDEAYDITQGLVNVSANYGKSFAQQIEQMIRLETRNFESKQWRIGSSAGMEATKENFPFGWPSLQEFTDLNNLDPEWFNTYPMIENGTGKTKIFIGFPNPTNFIDFLAWFITNKRGGDVGKWYSLDTGKASQYRAALQEIEPKIVNSFS